MVVVFSHRPEELILYLCQLCGELVICGLFVDRLCFCGGFFGLRVLWCALHNLFGLRGLHGLRILCVRCNLYVRLCLCALRGLCSLFGLRVLFGRLCLCSLFLGGIVFRVAQPLPRFLQRRHPFGNFVCARHQLGDGAAPCGRAGVRLDDAICGVHIYGNRFERASRGNFGGVQIHGGKDNRVEWNLFLDDRIGVSFSPWEQARWEEFLDRKETRVLTQSRFDVRDPAHVARYPELAHLRERPNANTVAYNLLIGSEIPFTRSHAHTDLHGNARFATLDQVDATLAPFALEDLPPESEIGTYSAGAP